VEEMRRLPERDSRDPRIDLLEATAADVLADYPRATAMAARAAEKATADGAKLMLARARIKQGVYAVRVGKFDDGSAFFAEAEALFGEMGEAGGVADALRWQGFIANDRLRLDEAVKYYERAYAIAAPLNYVRLTAIIQQSQANIARLQGNFAKAAALGDRTAQANALSALGIALRMQGNYAGARDAYQRAAAIGGEIGDVRIENSAINSSGVIDFLTGDLAAARRKFETLLAEDRKMGAASGAALRLNNLSRVLALQDELVTAEKLNAEECRAYESLKSAVNLAWCRVRLADIWTELGRKGEAEALVTTIALEDFGGSALAPQYIARLARVQLALGQAGAAAATIAAAEKLQAKVGVNEEQSIHLSVIRAEVEAAQGRRAAAIERLKKARADADRLGLRTWSLDAGLVLARLDPREAAATERAAREGGFAFVARKARALAVATS
jgi:tetratricopeptide (TPR) repeat protein